MFAKSQVFAAGSLVFALFGLAGCSQLQPDSASSTDASNQASSQSAPLDFNVISNAKVADYAVSELRAECTNLSSYAAGAGNWVVESKVSDLAELRLYGDGGTLGIQAIPDSFGGVYLLISPDFADSTNPLLWNSGCVALASDPSQQ